MDKQAPDPFPIHVIQGILQFLPLSDRLAEARHILREHIYKLIPCVLQILHLATGILFVGGYPRLGDSFHTRLHFSHFVELK